MSAIRTSLVERSWYRLVLACPSYFSKGNETFLIIFTIGTISLWTLTFENMFEAEHIKLENTKHLIIASKCLNLSVVFVLSN